MARPNYPRARTRKASDSSGARRLHAVSFDRIPRGGSRRQPMGRHAVVSLALTGPCHKERRAAGTMLPPWCCKLRRSWPPSASPSGSSGTTSDCWDSPAGSWCRWRTPCCGRRSSCCTTSDRCSRSESSGSSPRGSTSPRPRRRWRCCCGRPPMPRRSRPRGWRAWRGPSRTWSRRRPGRSPARSSRSSRSTVRSAPAATRCRCSMPSSPKVPATCCGCGRTSSASRARTPWPRSCGAAVKQGRASRAIYPYRAWAEARPTLELRASVGEQIRLLPELPTRMFIIGATHVVLPEPLGFADEPRSLVRQPGIVHALSLWFEALWERAKPLPEFGAGRSRTPGAQRLPAARARAGRQGRGDRPHPRDQPAHGPAPGGGDDDRARRRLPLPGRRRGGTARVAVTSQGSSIE